ncbi:GIY-YIG nuclease family protein [Bradyrhizobium liaoningense]|uniref:GIY-YIG nuclease family protein n=1 Tax=Bradyrhizobium liaoningense TaxID=43992 RepID=UPI003D9AF69E
MQEVGGSIPPGSTSLRSLRELRLGKPAPLHRSEVSEGCRGRSPKGEAGPHQIERGCKLPLDDWGVCREIRLYSESLDSLHFYVGITDDLRTRLAKHNAGEVPHTSKYGPWRLKTYVAFSNEKQAVAFEKYLKSASGRAFAKKRL